MAFYYIELFFGILFQLMNATSMKSSFGPSESHKIQLMIHMQYILDVYLCVIPPISLTFSTYVQSSFIYLQGVPNRRWDTLYKHSNWKSTKNVTFDIFNFCTTKSRLSGNTVWLQASGFLKSPKWTIFVIFNELLSTQNKYKRSSLRSQY